jgi:hypothetical protein
MSQRHDRLLAILLVALSVSCVDLWTKIALPTPPWALHQRSFAWALGCWVLLLASVQLARIPSSAITIGAGLFAGGVLGNLISAGTDHLAVPNPLLLNADGGGFAFNLADASIMIGNLILMIALCHLVIMNRERLPRLRRTSSASGDPAGVEYGETRTGDQQ